MKDLLGKIVLGDCLEVMRDIPDNSIDLILTDPPFGMEFQSSYRYEKHRKIENDDNLDWLPAWCEQVNRVIKKDGFIFSFCSYHFVDVFKQQIEKYIKLKNVLIWHKNNTGMGDLTADFAPQYEMILYANLGNRPLLGRRDSNILRFPRTQNALHPTEKPKDLIGYLASKVITSGVVLDCFSGSGTTAIACHDLELDFICIEKDPDYWEASCKRLEQHQRQGRLF